MLEAIILGVIQGIAEWLPVSSEGLSVLAQVHLFGETNIKDAIELALFLHLGTFFAALVYFWRDVVVLVRGFFRPVTASQETKKINSFLISATIISGVIGYVLLTLFTAVADRFDATGRIITAAVGILLLVTAWLQLRSPKSGLKNTESITSLDTWLLGVVQGFTVLPGLSRSGLTVATFLLRGYQDTSALRLSFLMSLPIVLAGNIILNIDALIITMENIIGLVCAFVFGLATIHALLTIARKINFGYFVLLFAFITIIAAFI